MTTLFLLPALFVSMDVSTPASAAISTPPDPFDERALAAELWSHSPDLILSRQGLIEAEAVRDHSYVLPNPSLAAAWGTIPIGRRNPPGASFGEVPNYMVGVSEMIELGKRGPRQAAAEAGTKVAALTVDDTYRQSFFTLLETLAEQANATARRAVLNRLVGDSAEACACSANAQSAVTLRPWKWIGWRSSTFASCRQRARPRRLRRSRSGPVPGSWAPIVRASPARTAHAAFSLKGIPGCRSMRAWMTSKPCLADPTC